MKGRKPFRTRMKVLFAAVATFMGGTIVGGGAEMLPKDPVTDTQQITSNWGEYGVNVSPVDQFWKASLSMMDDNEKLGEAVEAARNGDSWRVRVLMASGVSPYSPETHKALAIAAGNGHEDVVDAFLRAGVDAGANDGAALVEAIRGNQYRLAFRFLNDYNVNGNAGNGDALIFAASKGQTELVDTLLARGADARAQDSGALRYAAMMGQDTPVSALLNAGADPKANDNEAVLNFAEAGNLHGLTQVVRAGGNLAAQNGAALVKAATNGHTPVVKYILSFKTTISDEYSGSYEFPLVSANTDGGMALRMAVDGRHIGTAEALLDAGAFINVSDGSPLTIAAYNGDMNMMRMLLARGADANAGNGSALQISTFMGNIDSARTLIEAGADINARNGEIKARVTEQGSQEMKDLFAKPPANVTTTPVGPGFGM